MKLFFLIFLTFYFILDECSALDKKKFLSTKYNEVNLRKGPGLQHFITAKFLRKGIPLQVVGSFDNWRKVKFLNKKEGWVAKSQLSNIKYGIIINENVGLNYFPNKKSKKTAILQKNIIFKILKCRSNWCKINFLDAQGWILKSDFWGVDKSEIF